MRKVDIHILDKSLDQCGGLLYAVVLDTSAVSHQSEYYRTEDNISLLYSALKYLLVAIENYDLSSCRLTLYSEEHLLNTLYPSGKIVDALHEGSTDLDHKDLWRKVTGVILVRDIKLYFKPSKIFSG